MSVGLDVKWCPVLRITTSLALKKTVSLEFVEEKARKGRQGNFINQSPPIYGRILRYGVN